MSLVWAVVKGDLLTTAFWALVYGIIAYLVARRARVRSKAARGLFTTPRWAREPQTPESLYRLARMRQRRSEAPGKPPASARMLRARLRNDGKQAWRQWWSGVCEATREHAERYRPRLGGSPRGQA